jgi:hypothetical protein
VPSKYTAAYYSGCLEKERNYKVFFNYKKNEKEKEIGSV